MENNEKKMVNLKSRHDLIMEEFEKAGKVTTFTAEENASIVSGIYSGMSDFLYSQKKKEKASELELIGCILNA
jgi:hypothetical protein